jgi:signal transduction histidine kinase
MKSLRLQAQIALATFLPLVILALLSATVSAYALQRIPEELAMQRQTVLAKMAATSVSNHLKGHVRLLEVVAADLGPASGYPNVQRQLLEERAAALGGFSAGVALLDERGTAIAAAGEQNAALGLNYAFRPYFQEVKESMAPAFSTVLRDIPYGYNAVMIAVPVRFQDAFAGVLVGEFALARSEWAQDLDLLQIGEGSRAYLADSTGTIIYHPEATRIGTTIQNEPALWELISAGLPDSVIYHPAGRDETVAASVSAIPGVAWTVVLEEPWTRILSTVRPYQWLVGGLLVLGITLALGALIYSVRRVTRPVNALIEAGRRVADGEPFEPLPLMGPPDMQTLIEVINRMVDRLAEQGAALRRYASLVLRGQEEERLRIARDLHDETVQDLIALGQRIDLCQVLLEEDLATARSEMVALHAMTRKAISEVRRMSNHLRPSILEDLGLAAGFETLCRELEQLLPKTKVSCEIVGRERRLPPEIELTAFRIAQEALANVRKHAAKSSQVHVALFFEAAGIHLLVEDDGPGFEAQEREQYLQEGHLGLTGMTERAYLFGGELKVSSRPGEGTQISLRLDTDVR